MLHVAVLRAYSYPVIINCSTSKLAVQCQGKLHYHNICIPWKVKLLVTSNLTFHGMHNYGSVVGYLLHSDSVYS